MVKGGWLFDVSYSPWPSVAAMSWESERTISGLEMLIWQAISQIEFFAHSQAISIEGVEKQLYQVMKSAVSAA
jgi:shikimate 5-dehydrogenase